MNAIQERKDKETKDVANMFKAAMVSLDHKAHDKLWYLDSRASKHVNGDMNAMFKLLGVGPSSVRTACGQNHLVKEEGNMICSYNGSINQNNHVLYIPGITKAFC